MMRRTPWWSVVKIISYFNKMRLKLPFGTAGFLGIMLVLASGRAEAVVQTRVVSLCDGIKAEVTVVSSRHSKGTMLSAINFAATGARDSCKTLSDRHSKSQVRSINAQAGQAAVPVGLDLQYLMPRTVQLSRLTAGAFDPTAWSRRKRASYQDIVIDPARRAIMLKKKGDSLSFRGLLKGYLADRMAARLRKKG